MPAFTYDANGNLTADGAMRVFTWGDEGCGVLAETPHQNRLARVVAASGTCAVEFTYNGLGWRVEKRVYALSGTTQTLQKATRFVYDGVLPVEEYDATAGAQNLALVRSTTWGLDLSNTEQGAGGVSGLLCDTIQNSTSSTHHYFGYDGNGNVTDVLDEAGDTVAHYEYGPFGERLVAQGDYAAANPWRWSTKFTDTETGLVYYGMRYYAPELGRWINRDPIGEAGGVNVYGFVSNDPENAIDMLGLDRYTDRHPKGSCHPTKGCPENYDILKNYLRPIIIRLREDFTDNLRDLAERQVKHPSPRYPTYQESWNGHVDQVWQMISASGKCIIILKAQIESGKCCPPDEMRKRTSLAQNIWARSKARIPSRIESTLLQSLNNDVMNSGGPTNWLLQHGLLAPPDPIPVPAL